AEFHNGLLQSHFKTVCYLSGAVRLRLNSWRTFLFFGGQYGSPGFKSTANRIVKKLQIIFTLHQKGLHVHVQTRSSKRYLTGDCHPDQVRPIFAVTQNLINFLECIWRKSNHSFVNESLRSGHPVFIRGRCHWVQIAPLNLILGYLLLTYKIALWQMQTMSRFPKLLLCSLVVAL
ncbi:hypothetical protein, partial [Acidiphilium sp.]|uniref:hypothetical protein n=1 Tax=Acidiphilium sp. TaxID=527 RepID=UPI003D07B69F